MTGNVVDFSDFSLISSVFWIAFFEYDLQHVPMPTVNPDILRWARESAGLSEEVASDKLGLSSADRLRALESGDRPPSRRQLANMSVTYRRPLVVFYLNDRPRDRRTDHDFRTLPAEPVPEDEALLAALLRNLYARQEIVRATLEEAEEDARLGFVGSISLSIGISAAADKIREVIGFDTADFRQERGVRYAFGSLRSAVERAGVFVLLMGNFGTHHTDIDAKTFRGFAISDPIAPFIVINENDSLSAWSFTMLHELVHILLGHTAVSGYESNAEEESFCDAVAARFLLDPSELDEFKGADDVQDLIPHLTKFSDERNVSRKMVAYNLLQTSTINDRTYRNLVEHFDAERLRMERERKAKAAERASGGPSYYKVRQHRLGNGLLDFAGRMLSGGTLTTTKAGQVLGVKPTSVGRLVSLKRAG